MEIKNLFSDTIHRLEKNLDLRSRRHNVIVSNIANKDTPGYRAFDLMVAKEMNRSEPNASFGLTRTHPMHREGGRVKTDNGQLTEIEKQPFSSGKKGNPVDLDKEMGKLSENSLLYNVTAHILSKKIGALKTAIQGGRK